MLENAVIDAERPIPPTAASAAASAVKVSAERCSVTYGDKQALFDIDLEIPANEVTSLIGPSGCGKSTFLRCINRMNDIIDGCRVSGAVRLDGDDIYHPAVDVVHLRARIGMVFQKPNPFPKSIYENVAYGPRIHGLASGKAEMDEMVERSLRRAGLWDEVKDRLEQPGTGFVRRSATAPVHRPRHRRAAGSDPHGRTLLRPRPHRHGEDRGTDRRTA